MKKTFLSAMCALFLCSGLSAKVIYVTTDGNDNNAGTSWDTAVKDLNVAIEKADKGDDIYIAAGTYYFNATINMKDGVSFYGGFAKGETSIEARQRPNPQTEPWNFTNETIFTGESKERLMDRIDKSSLWDMLYVDGITFKNYRVTENFRLLYFRNSVTFQNNKVINCAGTKATLVYGEENLIVRNCYFADNYDLSNISDAGSVVYFCGCNNKVKTNRMENCLFENNKILSFGLYNYTPASSVLPGSPENPEDEVLITKCVFKNNTEKCISIAYDWSQGTMAITDCLFEGNTSIANGTVFSGRSNVQATFANNIIRNNQCLSEDNTAWRSAIITTVANIVIANNLIVNNTSNHLLIDNQGGTHLNNTIANNKGTLYIDGAGEPFVYNNIIVNNEASREKGIEVVKGDQKDCWIEYNAFDTEIDFNGVTNGNNVMDATPFVNPASFKGAAADATQKEESEKADYSLKENSLSINSGTIDLDYNCELKDAWVERFFKKDIAGNDRMVDGKINMGAYQGAALTGIRTDKVDNGSSVIACGNQLLIKTDMNSQVEIYSLVGEMVLSMPVVAGENTVGVSSNGFYLVKVSNANGAKTFKVLVK